MSLFVAQNDKNFFNAIRTGNAEKLDTIITTKSVDPNVRNWADANGLHIAAFYNQPQLMPQLVAFGTDINGFGWGDNTPIATAASEGNRQSVQKLLTLGADPDLRHHNQPTPP